MSRKFRKPPCYGNAWGEDCKSCKYTKECEKVIKKAKADFKGGLTDGKKR